MLLTLTAVANPQLDVSNPTNFFTTVATAMFQQMDLHDFNGNLVTITNIPIYEDPARVGVTNINYYTPAVHRVLQLAANLLDATTNRFIGDGPTNYPTVFRPLFSSHNGIVYISGYVEVNNTTDPFLPYLERTNFVKAEQSDNKIANIYGVPWVIGAKKGFPNFNEFSMENPVTIGRKLTFTNNTARPPWTTNQLYTINITNTFGFELWNSYTNAYNRPLSVTVSNEMSIRVFDENGLVLLAVQNLGFGTRVTYNLWEGWSRQIQDPFSFKVPMGIFATNFINGIYQKNLPQFIPLNPPLLGVTFVPHLRMTLELKVRCVVIDTAANRVIDFVNIDSTQPPVDIARYLNNGATGQFPNFNSLDGQWDTNQLHNVEVGIWNQIEVSKGGSANIWTDPNKIIKAQFFNHALLNGGTNYFQAPYTPQRTIHQSISWQANDPLVHYTESDITSTNGAQQRYNIVSLVGENPPLPNVGGLNFAYQPWGGYHTPGGSPQMATPYDFDVRVKDPGVQQSDDWNFPTGESLSFEWLGRVHRGTPWQTVFLKSSNQTFGQWLNWDNDNILVTNGNNIFVDAVFTYPNNDWHFAGLWARWLNTNDLSALLSINNTDTNAWAARLDGLTALTNSASDELDPITISSNSPQAGIIAQAIQAARANTNSLNGIVFPNHAFQNAGDVLVASQLSAGSPFINTNGLSSLNANGITDEALEKIPTQLLPLLRVDSFGKIVPANGQLELSFSGYDGHAYAIEASSNFTDWVIISTNCPLDGNFGITNTATSGQLFYRSGTAALRPKEFCIRRAVVAFLFSSFAFHGGE